MTDDHRDVESVPTVGGGGLDAFTHDIFAEFACSSKTPKLTQMKKLPNGPVASKQGAHSSVKSVGTLEASIQSNQHELLPFELSFAENVDTNEIETQTEVFAASTQLTYGSVLEKMEAGRSTKARSWEFSCARFAKHKRQEIPNPPPLPVKGNGTFAAEQRRLRPIDDLCYIVKHWALSSPELPKNDAFLGSRQNLLRIVLDLLDEAALIRHINKRCSQNCTFPLRPALPIADEATSHFATACTASTGATTCLEATEVKKEETGCGNMAAAIVAWMRAPENGDQKNLI